MYVLLLSFLCRYYLQVNTEDEDGETGGCSSGLAVCAQNTEPVVSFVDDVAPISFRDLFVDPSPPPFFMLSALFHADLAGNDSIVQYLKSKGATE